MITLTKNKETARLVRRTVLETVREIFSDPDEGLELSEETSKILKKYSNGKHQRFVSLKDITKRLAL